MEEFEQQIKGYLRQNFDLQEEHLVGKEKIIEALSQRIDSLLAGNPDRLFSLLYRLDINERKIKTVLQTKENVSRHLAELVYTRQIEKAESRKRFKSDKSDDELSW